MPNELQKALDGVHAAEKLKHSTTTYLRGEIKRRRNRLSAALRYAMAGCCCFVLMSGFGGYFAFAAPVSYISVEVNPSIELALNRIDRVVSVKTYNDDGRLVMQNLNLKNRIYTDALEILLADETFLSYLANDSLLSFTVASPKEETLLAGIRGCRGYEQYGGECHRIDESNAKAAHHSGISVGRYDIYRELSRLDDSFTEEEGRKMSMRQLRDLLLQYSGAQEENGTSNCGEQGDSCGMRRNRHHR